MTAARLWGCSQLCSGVTSPATRTVTLAKRCLREVLHWCLMRSTACDTLTTQEPVLTLLHFTDEETEFLGAEAVCPSLSGTQE